LRTYLEGAERVTSNIEYPRFDVIKETPEDGRIKYYFRELFVFECFSQDRPAIQGDFMILIPIRTMSTKATIECNTLLLGRVRSHPSAPGIRRSDNVFRPPASAGAY
jgi:hypothetical protein